MFNKKVKFILVTLIFLISISAVAAVETNSSDDLEIGDVDEEPPSGSIEEISAADVSSSNKENTLNGAVANRGDVLASGVIDDVNENDLLSSVENISSNDVLSTSNEYTIKSNDLTMYYKNGSKFVVTLLKDSNPVKSASLSITINGVVYKKVTSSSGMISIPINLNVGNYTATTTYGDITVKNKIKVRPVVIASSFVKTYGNTKMYPAKFLDNNGNPLKNTGVKFILNNKRYSVKTNTNGVARINVDLKVGSYTVYAIHPNGYKIAHRVIIKNSVVANDLSKHYKSYKKFCSTFYDKNGKVMAGKYIKFYCIGKYFTKKTNSKGMASLAITVAPGTYKIISINPDTGQKANNLIEVLPTLYAKKITTFTGVSTTFKVKLYKNEELVKNAKVYVHINGKKYLVRTDSNGVANHNFSFKSKGTYIFKSYDPYTGHSIDTKVVVLLSSIKADNMYVIENKDSKFTATLLTQTGSVAKNTNMQITLNGKTNTVKTDSNGVATLNFKLDEGTYKVTCKDLSTGYTITKKIYVFDMSSTYDKYGVSADGKSILAIGRASASGEESKYGYSFYETEFIRTCSYCGSHNLYWSIFWAGSETANWGVFPATGNSEGSSAEGGIFCADCDSDWSVFGHNHGGGGGDLIRISSTTASSKEDAYLLKSGNYVKP